MMFVSWFSAFQGFQKIWDDVEKGCVRRVSHGCVGNENICSEESKPLSFGLSERVMLTRIFLENRQ